jgi:hypothetical protein
LYCGSTRQGKITFQSLIVKKPSDYICEPEGILVYDEAKDLLSQVRRAPLSEAGVIGKCAWQI